MLSLIKNELFKLFHSKKIYVFGIIITIFAVIFTIAAKKFPDSITNININTIAEGMLQTMMGTIFQIFSIIIISDMITDEYRSGTLKLSMIHPVSRAQYFAAKVISLTIITLLMMIFTMVISYLLNIIVLGMGEPVSASAVFEVIKGYILSIIPLLGFDMIIFFIAIILSKGGAVIGLSIGLLFVFDIAGTFIKDIKDYMITNYFGLFTTNGQTTELTKSLIIVAAYIVVFYFLSNLLFKQKDILE